MEDLPPPIKVTPDFQNAPEPTGIIPKRPNFLKKAFNFIVKIKWKGVSVYIIGFVGVVSIVYNLPVARNLIEKNFPNSSPVFGREVSMQGVLKTSSTGLYILVLPDQQAYSLHFKPSVSLTNLKKLNEVVVKGRLGWTAYVIEDAEIYPLNFTIPDESDSSLKSQISFISQISPDISDSPDTSETPAIYPGLSWETTQKRLLIFTSGKRKIEQEGVYLESVQVSVFPQDFINYYIEGLKEAGFKETLNSINPEGIVITYAKDDLFLTFGIKNIYKGSAEKKQLLGYKAFVEHN